MSRNRAASDGANAAKLTLAGVVALLLAIGFGLLLTELLMSPPSGDLRSLALYFALTGAGTIAGGSIFIYALEHRAGASIRTKSLLAALAGTVVALVNVLIVAQLMFVSTSHDLRLLMAVIGFSAVVSLFFALWVASSMTSRVEDVARTVRELATGRYGERARTGGRDEVTSLARDINTLAERLQEAENERTALDAQRRELTASISHDLRTPLASLRAMIEALDDEVVADRAEVRRYYVTMRREIDRLGRMIDGLFELAQIDAGVLRLERQPVLLQEIAAEVVDAMQAQAAQRGIALSIEVHRELPTLSLDGARIERAIGNLVRNALEHTPEGGRVDVTVGSGARSALVQVSDNGEGIAESDLPHIWTRFYRAERSRARSGGTDGAGLGLAITRGIVESHGGSVEATSGAGAGTTVTLHLPLVAAPAVPPVPATAVR